MRIFAAVGALAITMTVAVPLHAQEYSVTYSGLLALPSTDVTGIFGTPGDFSPSDTFTATYYYNYPVAGSNQVQTSNFNLITGGSGEAGFVSPILYATLTIHGYTYTFGTSYASTIYYRDDNSPDTIEAAAYSSPQTFMDTFFRGGDDFLNTVDPTAPYSHTLQSGEASVGHFTIYDPDTGASADGILYTESVVVAAVTAVPEPSTWALMLMGFGGMGLVLRRRNSTGAQLV
jgi:hypothetical protein